MLKRIQQLKSKRRQHRRAAIGKRPKTIYVTSSDDESIDSTNQHPAQQPPQPLQQQDPEVPRDDQPIDEEDNTNMENMDPNNVENMETEPNAETPDHYEGLPEHLFGINVRQQGSATLGHQLLMFNKIQQLEEAAQSITEEVNKMRGELLQTNSTYRTVVDGMRAGQQAWEQLQKDSLAQHITKLEKSLWDRTQQQIDQQRQPQDHQDRLHEDAVPTGPSTSLDHYRIPKKPSPPPAEPLPTPPQQQHQLRHAGPPQMQYDTNPFYKSGTGPQHRRRVQKTVYSCILCVSNQHQSHRCPVFNTVNTRRQRMEELQLCTGCAKLHYGECRHTTPVPCLLCVPPTNEDHITILCPSMESTPPSTTL